MVCRALRPKSRHSIAFVEWLNQHPSSSRARSLRMVRQARLSQRRCPAIRDRAGNTTHGFTANAGPPGINRDGGEPSRH